MTNHKRGLIGDDVTPTLLDRLELQKVAKEKNLNNEMIVSRLREIIIGENDVTALRAIEVTERMVRDSGNQPGGKTTINGNVSFSANFVKLEQALEDVSPEKRREILDAMTSDAPPDE